jgi:hypothetical protein
VASFQAQGRRAEVSDDKSKRAKPPTYPPTFGEFVGLGWRMQGLCVPCNGIDKFQVDTVAAAKALGDAYPMRDFMLSQMCQQCGQKLSLYDWSPQELRDHAGKWWQRAR